MTDDERPHSLAAQAASWVPPWERAVREPDRAYQAAAGAEANDDDAPAPAPGVAPVESPSRPRAQAGDPHDEPTEPADVPAELAPLPGESGGPVTVDAPTELPGDDEPGPTELGGVPDVPVPASIEDAIEAAGPGEFGSPVDAPVPADGDDAAGVFDADDRDDDAERDLPSQEEIPPGGSPGDAPGEAGDEPPAEAPQEQPPGEAGDGDEDGDGAPQESPGDARGPAADGAPGERPGAVAVAIPAQGRPGRVAQAPPAAEPHLLTDDAELRAALESILLVVDEPVAELQLAQILEQPAERVAAMLDDISARYTAAGHGFDLRRAAGGWRLYTRPEYAPYVERFVLDGQSVRLTQAALETLAVVAYKQPVTRSRISAIRGVNCDGVMRTLVTRGLIEECGTEGETGAYLYRTTGLFLEKLGLNSVDQLPPLAPFLPDDVEEVLDASG